MRESALAHDIFLFILWLPSSAQQALPLAQMIYFETPSLYHPTPTYSSAQHLRA